MPLTSAEKQRRYRQRNKRARLDVVVRYSTLSALYKLATHRGTSLRQALESAIEAADKAEQASMTHNQQWHYSQNGARRMERRQRRNQCNTASSSEL